MTQIKTINAVKPSLLMIWRQSCWEGLADGSLLVMCEFQNSFNMPLRAMTSDTRNYFGQQKVNLSQPSFGPYL